MQPGWRRERGGDWTFAENIIGMAPMTLSLKLCSGVAGPRSVSLNKERGLRRDVCAASVALAHSEERGARHRHHWLTLPC